MKRLLLIVLLTAACSSRAYTVTEDGTAAVPVYWHDDAHGVSCWIAYASKALSCLPDSQVRR